MEDREKRETIECDPNDLSKAVGQVANRWANDQIEYRLRAIRRFVRNTWFVTSGMFIAALAIDLLLGDNPFLRYASVIFACAVIGGVRIAWLARPCQVECSTWFEPFDENNPVHQRIMEQPMQDE